MNTSSDASETVLDLRGPNCPQPVLRAKKALRNLPVGGILVLQCTDPLSVIDIPHFVTGHTPEGAGAARPALHLPPHEAEVRKAVRRIPVQGGDAT